MTTLSRHRFYYHENALQRAYRLASNTGRRHEVYRERIGYGRYGRWVVREVDYGELSGINATQG